MVPGFEAVLMEVINSLAYPVSDRIYHSETLPYWEHFQTEEGKATFTASPETLGDENDALAALTGYSFRTRLEQNVPSVVRYAHLQSGACVHWYLFGCRAGDQEEVTTGLLREEFISEGLFILLDPEYQEPILSLPQLVSKGTGNHGVLYLGRSLVQGSDFVTHWECDVTLAQTLITDEDLGKMVVPGRIYNQDLQEAFQSFQKEFSGVYTPQKSKQLRNFLFTLDECLSSTFE